MADDESLLPLLQHATAELKRLNDEVERLRGMAREPIAIIGMGCRFPGGAVDPAGYWRVLLEGRDVIREVAPRWQKTWPHALPPPEDGTRWAGLLDDYDGFDADFFSLSPVEAAEVDPQQRLLLEVVWEALERANQPAPSLVNSRTGVFIGIGLHDYEHLLLHARGVKEAYAATGRMNTFAAGRLSYFLGVQGPCVALDTACSSSLVAVHLACQSLRSGESRMAIVGATNLLLSPLTMDTAGALQALSPDGRCHTFDAAANGFVRGEGVAAVVLKRLSDAQRDGDPVLAVIRGSAINQDGRSSGMTAPSVQAQIDLLRLALDDARLNAEQIGYVEAHGTGTSLGDPIEMEALREVLGAPRADGSVCAIASAKTCLGHLEATAGLAGLIKVVLTLQHETIPRHVNFETLNPRIRLENTPFVIPTEARPWPRGSKPRYAGVSSFGISGTNAHVIVEEAPPAAAVGALPPLDPAILALSAKSEAGLKALANSYLEVLRHDGSLLHPMCFTHNTRRTHHAYRGALVAGSADAMATQLAALAAGKENDDVHAGSAFAPPKVAFLFSGQGSQYAGMGKGLYGQWPVFRAALDECAEHLCPHLDRPLLEVMFADPGDDTLKQTIYAQPALFALGYALTRLWASFGVQAHAVLGHSVGEYVAACVAGVMTLPEGLRLIAARGRHMQALTAKGSMVAVVAAPELVEELVATHRAQVALAALNGPLNTVISGAAADVEAICAQLKQRGIQYKALQVSHAYHSPLLEPMLDALERDASTIHYRAPQVPLISNLSGSALTSGETLSGRYWRDHARLPVRFQQGMNALASCDVFVEIGPHPVLCGLGQGCLPDAPAAWIPSLQRQQSDNAMLMRALAAVYSRGCPVRWQAVYEGGGRLASLPTYPFQRRPYWTALKAAAPVALAHPAAVGQSKGVESSVPAQAAPSDDGELQRQIRNAPAALHEQIVAAHVRQIVGEVLGSPEAVPANPMQPLLEAGIDSLMAVRLARRLGQSLNRAVPATLALQHPTMQSLSSYVLKLLQTTAAPKANPITTPHASSHAAVASQSAPAPSTPATDLALAIVGAQVPSNAGSESLYTARYSVERMAFLADHRLFGKVIVSLAQHLTRVLLAARQRWGQEAAMLEDVIIERPMFLDDDEELETRLVLREVPGGRACEFEIVSATAGDAWTVHLTGRVSPGAPAPAGVSLSTWQSDLARHTLEQPYEQLLANDAFVYGRGYRWVERLSEQPQRAVAQLRAADDQEGPLHPGVVDAVLQVAFAPMVRRAKEAGCEALPPVAIDALHVYQWPRGKTFCEGTVQTSDNVEHVIADSTLVSDAGVPVMRVDKVHFRHTRRAVILQSIRSGARRLLYDVAWQPAPAKAPATLTPGNAWLILQDAGGIAQQLASQLEAQQQRCTLVPAGASLETLQAHLANGVPYTGVVYLWGVNDTEPQNAEALMAQQREVSGKSLSCVQLLLQHAWNVVPRFYFITRGAVQVPGDTHALALSQATLWGLGRTVATEHPELCCRCVDIDPGAAVQGTLTQVLADAEADSQMALRNNRVLVARLGRHVSPAAASLPTLHGDGAYVIVGGLGALGLDLARWLAERGARHIHLLGRSAPPAAALAAVQELAVQNVAVTTHQVDAALSAPLAATLASIRAQAGRIRGIFHCAGVLADAALLRQDWQRFERVYQAKIVVAWNLHKATLSDALDAFVCFSSLTALLGTPGQANYAAANAWLDAFAWERRRLGLVASSINWGAWEGGGMAAGVALAPGVRALSRETGLQALGEVMQSGATQVAVAAIAWREFLAALGPLANNSFFATLRPIDAVVQPSTKDIGVLLKELAAAPSSLHEQIVMTHVRQAVADVLGNAQAVPANPSQLLVEAGLDSILSVRLAQRIGHMVSRKVPATLVLQHPHVAALTQYVLQLMLAQLHKDVARPPSGKGLAGARQATGRARAGSALGSDLADLVAEIEQGTSKHGKPGNT